MKSNAAVIATFCLFSSGAAFAQGAVAASGPPTETIAPDIPRCCRRWDKSSTKCQRIGSGHGRAISPSGRQPHLTETNAN